VNEAARFAQRMVELGEQPVDTWLSIPPPE